MSQCVKISYSRRMFLFNEKVAKIYFIYLYLFICYVKLKQLVSLQLGIQYTIVFYMNELRNYDCFPRWGLLLYLGSCNACLTWKAWFRRILNKFSKKDRNSWFFFNLISALWFKQLCMVFIMRCIQYKMMPQIILYKEILKKVFPVWKFVKSFQNRTFQVGYVYPLVFKYFNF